MSAGNGHPYSTFALDVFRASGNPPDPVLEEHLRGCSKCRAYLEELDALDAKPAPVWAPSAKPHPGRRGWLRLQWMAPLASAAAVVIGVVVWNTRDKNVAPYVGVKGTPAVQVLVRSGGETRIWDGRTPVHPGDALAIRVDCQGFARVVVTTASVPGPATRLFDGACPTVTAPLPFTLIPDEQPGEERIAVTFSEQALDDRTLAAALGATSRSGGVWVAPLTFPKEVKP